MNRRVTGKKSAARRIAVLFLLIPCLALLCPKTVSAQETYGPTDQAKMIEIINSCCDPDDYLTIDDSKEDNKKLKTAANALVAGIESDYEKIRKICYSVADRVYYDYDDYYHGASPQEGSLDPYKIWFDQVPTVCVGYQLLTFTLFRLAGIPCMNIEGSDHIFGAAYDRQDARWIIFDTTWLSRNRYEYGEYYHENEFWDAWFDADAATLRNNTYAHEMSFSGAKINGLVYAVKYSVPASGRILTMSGVCETREKIDIPAYVEDYPVTKIEGGYRKDGVTVKALRIPNTVTSIGNFAFLFGEKLRTIEIPASVSEISPAAFYSTPSDMTLIVKPDSFALQYAENHGLRYEINPFDDVSSLASYYNSVQWAVQNGIISGTSKTAFSPDKPCTRYQFAVMLYKLAGKPDVSGVKIPFKDVPAKASYHDAVAWAYNSGIISGTSKTTFSPDKTVTRYQVVQMLYKMAGKPAVSGTNPFTDVSESSSYYKAVLWAVQNKITSGTTASTFSPNAGCKRYQMVVFLNKAS
ncbi:MAG: S-layer homology domain-containing protein [Lachnospiraceae bacterium]|nr:S-layer homology domain-containing protein [Lachnospiraceae bacterium]